ncbi:serine/threonine-protein kinase [Streptomyces sp. NBC_00271]|uniref:serine/threonine-protein kinase n=1 Tax=Streptomyces sp. NBC_00271 TaxID=2975697 RepID=UPI002E2CD321|nr:serine/threonine-protein kinase [Streptomyces sp. NBC_00271]
MQKEDWLIGPRIGDKSGFGTVFRGQSPTRIGAVKLVPKEKGAERELLFVDLAGKPNVIPVIDWGETEQAWALAMPLAEKSLRARLIESAGPLGLPETINILRDIVTAIAGLNGKVVHRDIKPENVLLWEEKWCLVDFGISRYAEATTAPDTRKYFWTQAYAAPEQWRWERATAATDIYSTGIIGFEMLTGRRPFMGPDFREQHLHGPFPRDVVAPRQIMALVEECMYKAAPARPTAANLLSRLERVASSARSAGLEELEKAHAEIVAERWERERKWSEGLSESENRATLLQVAVHGLTSMGETLREQIIGAAPSAVETSRRNEAWEIQLGPSALKFQCAVATVDSDPWGTPVSPQIDVIACVEIHVECPPDGSNYTGRGHSLWFCDVREAGNYRWFETAFMSSPTTSVFDAEVPFPLPPGADSAGPLTGDTQRYEVAWPFTPIDFEKITEFVDRWALWLGSAARGSLSRPDPLPEINPSGSWRV